VLLNDDLTLNSLPAWEAGYRLVITQKGIPTKMIKRDQLEHGCVGDILFLRVQARVYIFVFVFVITKSLGKEC
jgi:hypothetical protein